jgi:hypothetical protein
MRSSSLNAGLTRQAGVGAPFDPGCLGGGIYSEQVSVLGLRVPRPTSWGSAEWPWLGTERMARKHVGERAGVVKDGRDRIPENNRRVHPGKEKAS